MLAGGEGLPGGPTPAKPPWSEVIVYWNLLLWPKGELLGGNSLVVTSVTLTGHVCLFVTGGGMFWPELVDFRTPEVR